MAIILNSKYIRRRRFARVRHAPKLKKFLAGQVTALAATATAKTLTPVRTTNTKAEALVTFGGQPSANDFLNINGVTFTYKGSLTEVKATGTLTNDGSNVTAADTVTIDSSIYTFKAALTEAKAAVTLTNDGVNVTAADTVTIGGNVYTFKTNLTEAKAAVTLTNDGVNVSNGDTVTVGGKTYTFQTTLTQVDGNVHIGASNTASMTSLFQAINASGGVVGTDYATGTIANANVTATNPSGTTVVCTAKVAGVAGNAIASTETSSHLSFGTATLVGGVDSIANEVKVGAANTNSMTNLFEAVNAGANAGTDYSTATVVHPTVVATNPSGTTVVLTAKSVGTAGNAIVSTETSSHLSFGTATLVGGVASIANEVKVGASNTASMTNLFEAINAGANVGVDYSTATVAHATVSATNPSGTTVVVTAKSPGPLGNVASTETSSHLSFGAVTLLGGVAAVANEVLIDSTAATSRDNLMNAINAGTGVGTKYSTGTVAQPAVVASASGANLLLTAANTVNLQRGKDVKLSKSGTNLTLSGSTLDGPGWTSTAHGFADGTGPYLLTNSGGGLPTGSPVAGTQVWIHKIDANTIALGAGHEAVKTGDYIQTTSAGTGTHSLTRDVTQAGILGTLKARVGNVHNSARKIAKATDIDNL